MNRHLIWIIAGTSVLGLGVPAFAAARSAGSPDDNGVPGDVRGNCDEAEHAGDPECLMVVGPGPTTNAVVVTVPSTSPSTVPGNTIPNNTVPASTTSDNTVPGNTVASGNRTSVVGALPATSVPGSNQIDISGPCDEPEHANDPQCTGVGDDARQHDLDDDNSGHHDSDDLDDLDDDSSGRSSDDHDDDDEDDHSGPGHEGTDDDSSSGHGDGDDD